MKILKSANYKKISVRRGTFKYKCDECGEFTYLTAIDRSRASIPRCPSCGSTWLDPVVEDSKNRLQDAQDLFHERVDLMKSKMNY